MHPNVIPSRTSVLFINSAQRSEGDKSRFCVDILPALMDMGYGDQNATHLEASVGMLYVPFERNSKGFVKRQPESHATPQVQLLRLHTDLANHNITQSNHSGVILQIPFLAHYEEAPEPPNGEVSFSHVSYEADISHNRFSLFHGLQGVTCATFWITDEKDRLIVPADDWYLNLVFEYKHNSQAETKTFHKKVLEGLHSLEAHNRLLLFQGDNRFHRQNLAGVGEEESTEVSTEEGEDNAGFL